MYYFLALMAIVIIWSFISPIIKEKRIRAKKVLVKTTGVIKDFICVAYLKKGRDASANEVARSAIAVIEFTDTNGIVRTHLHEAPKYSSTVSLGNGFFSNASFIKKFPIDKQVVIEYEPTTLEKDQISYTKTYINQPTYVDLDEWKKVTFNLLNGNSVYVSSYKHGKDISYDSYGKTILNKKNSIIKLP